jgi:hypothetical protein
MCIMRLEEDKKKIFPVYVQIIVRGWVSKNIRAQVQLVKSETEKKSATKKYKKRTFTRRNEIFFGKFQ